MTAVPIKVEGVVVGLVLVAVGVVWTLGNLGRLDALATLSRWWPIVLLAWGTLELWAWRLTRRDHARRTQ